MPTTHISSIRSMTTRLAYVTVGNGAERKQHLADGTVRYLKQMTDLDDVDGVAAYARSVRQRFSNRRLEGYEVRVSWSPDELDPNNPDDVDLAVAFGHELCHRLFPDCPVVITAHGDGDGGCLHVHCDVVNHHTLTEKAIRGDNRNHYHVSKISDELAESYGFRKVERHHANAWKLQRQQFEQSIEDYESRESGKWSRAHRDAVVRLAIGDAIAEALDDDAVVDLASFETVLGERFGCEIRRKEVRKKDGTVVTGFTYAMPVEVDGRTRMRRAKASAVCPEFDANHIEKTIEARLVERLRQEEADSNNVGLDAVGNAGEAPPNVVDMDASSRKEAVTALARAHTLIRQQFLYDDDRNMIGVRLSPNSRLFGEDGVDAASFTLLFDSVQSALDRVGRVAKAPVSERDFNALPPAPSLKEEVPDFVTEYERAAERVFSADTASRPTPDTFVGEVLGMIVRSAKNVWTKVAAVGEACALKLGQKERFGKTFGAIIQKVVGKRKQDVEAESQRRSGRVKPKHSHEDADEPVAASEPAAEKSVVDEEAAAAVLRAMSEVTRTLAEQRKRKDRMQKQKASSRAQHRASVARRNSGHGGLGS